MQKVRNEFSGGNSVITSIKNFSVLCKRFIREYLSSILKEYAGVTIEKMNTDWTKNAIYVKKTDCFYSFAGDFGPGELKIEWGVIKGGTVKLWEEGSHTLPLKKTGGSWKIVSHLLKN